jgi:hypothetical protein
MSFVCGLSQSCLRHPPPWMGYAGRDSETESAHPLKVKERRSATVDCLRLFVVPIYRRSREDLRQRRFSVLIFLRVRGMYRKEAKLESYLCVSHKFGL